MMQDVFLGCFLFGALFTVVSLILGVAGGGLHHLHAGDGGVDGAAHAGQIGHLAHGQGHAAPVDSPASPGDQQAPAHGGLPVLNVSSLLAFLTWFGATGYLLTRFAGWPVALAAPSAVAMGALGAVLVGLFLAKVLAGEREMDPRDYRLEGTIARVTVTVPAGGAGEVMFTKAGSRRSEAARSLSGTPIARDSEVVIIAYEHGIAAVQPWNEFIARTEPHPTERGQGAG